MLCFENNVFYEIWVEYLLSVFFLVGNEIIYFEIFAFLTYFQTGFLNDSVGWFDDMSILVRIFNIECCMGHCENWTHYSLVMINYVSLVNYYPLWRAYDVIEFANEIPKDGNPLLLSYSWFSFRWSKLFSFYFLF